MNAHDDSDLTFWSHCNDLTSVIFVLQGITWSVWPSLVILTSLWAGVENSGGKSPSFLPSAEVFHSWGYSTRRDLIFSAFNEEWGVKDWSLKEFRKKNLTYSTGHRISSKSWKVSSEFFRYLLTADDSPEGIAITESLADGDDVGDEVVLHEAPEVVAGPPQPGLDLVSDDEAAVSPDTTGQMEQSQSLSLRELNWVQLVKARVTDQRNWTLSGSQKTLSDLWSVYTGHLYTWEK